MHHSQKTRKIAVSKSKGRIFPAREGKDPCLSTSTLDLKYGGTDFGNPLVSGDVLCVAAPHLAEAPLSQHVVDPELVSRELPPALIQDRRLSLHGRGDPVPIKAGILLL